MGAALISKFSAFLAVLCACAALGAMAPAQAAQLMVVIDGSGSAAGRIGETRKIDIARNSLGSLLADAPADLLIGIAAYGHRVREQCTDYEVMVPPGPVDAANAAAARITPLGRSPIAEATVAAAETFGTGDVEGTVIVITDNADNCAPEPCAIIASLHDRMPNVTISVVGIAIPSDEVADIACFAELTGGLYLRAGDAAGFRRNLAEALEAAWSEPTPPPPPMPTARIDVPGGIVQGLPFQVAYQGPLDPRDEIRISWLGTAPQAHIVGAMIHADGTPVILTAPAERGAYELRYWHGARQTVIATARLLVVPMEAGLEAPATVFQGADFPVVWQADARGEERLEIAAPGAPIGAGLTDVEIGRTEHTVLVTAPAQVGQYELRLVRPAPAAIDGVLPEATGAVVIAAVPIEVVQAAATLVPQGPVVAGSRFTVAWTGPGGRNDDILLALPGQEPVAAERPTGDVVIFTAPFPAGRYELRYLSAATGTVIATAPVEITLPAATLEAPTEIVGGATFTVAWTGPGGANDRIAVAPNRPAGAPPIAVTNVSALGRPVVFDAPIAPGKYELRYLAGTEAATVATLVFDVTAPRVALAVEGNVVAGQPFAVRWEGPGGRYDEIRLTRSGQPNDTVIDAFRVTPGTPAQLTAPLEPGAYTLSYWAGAAEQSLGAVAITVAAAAP